MALRVALADDNFLVRRGTAALLAEAEDVKVVAVAEDTPSLLRAVADEAPDAVLTDLRMPPGYSTEGIEAARLIRRHHPHTGVVVLSQYVEPEDVVELLADGVTGLGYLLKERVARVEELVAALRAVSEGGSALDPRVVEALVARRTAEDRSPLAGLTERELAVLGEMATGKNNVAIARTLHVSERSVEKHTNALFAKLGLIEENDVNRRVLAVLTFLDARPPNR
jgi:DNA-binding NarL/FixJ family response regulator